MSDNDEIEVDFSNVPDRYEEHLKSDPDDFEVPPFWEADKHIHELYSKESLDKAFKLVRNGKVKNAGRPELFEVQGSELYVCAVIPLEDSVTPGITCTCPNGSNRSGRPTCYHSAAALMVYTDTDPGDVEMALAGFDKAAEALEDSKGTFGITPEDES